MQKKKNVIFIIFSIITLIICAPPPKIKPIEPIIVEKPTIVKTSNLALSSLKRANTEITFQLKDSTLTTYFHEDYQTLEH